MEKELSHYLQNFAIQNQLSKRCALTPLYPTDLFRPPPPPRLPQASSAGDEWENFDVEGLPEEKALRYRYDAVGGHWVTDDVTLKMEEESFNAGAMRRCFRWWETRERDPCVGIFLEVYH